VNVIPADGNPHHVALTVDRDNAIKLYVDGSSTNSLTPEDQAEDLSNDRPLRIGKLATESVNSPFKGIIDELSIYNRALSQADIQSIVNAGADGKALPPTITTQPVTQSVAAGANVTFTVGATGATARLSEARFRSPAYRIRADAPVPPPHPASQAASVAASPPLCAPAHTPAQSAAPAA